MSASGTRPGWRKIPGEIRGWNQKYLWSFRACLKTYRGRDVGCLATSQGAPTKPLLKIQRGSATPDSGSGRLVPKGLAPKRPSAASSLLARLSFKYTLLTLPYICPLGSQTRLSLCFQAGSRQIIWPQPPRCRGLV